MNKKISTLLAGVMLASAFSVNAAMENGKSYLHAAAQTVGHFSYNAYFYQLRSSKTPANAHEMKYVSALCIGMN